MRLEKYYLTGIAITFAALFMEGKQFAF